MEWQPIETAPMDTTEILACNPSAGTTTMLVRFCDLSFFLTGSQLYEQKRNGATEDDLYEPDWFYADFIEGGRLSSDCYPTLWMPLPKPPVTP